MLTLTVNLTPKRTRWKLLKKVKKSKRKVAKVRVKPTSNGISNVKHNRCAMNRVARSCLRDTVNCFHGCLQEGMNGHLPPRN